MYGYTITDKDITLVVNGAAYTVPRNSNRSEKLIEGIRAGAPAEELIALVDPTTHINAAGGGVVTVKRGVVTYNGKPVPGCLVRRLLSLLDDGLPVQHLVNFYERLNNNPSHRAVQELFTFLEHKNIPISPSGTLIMYKAIRDNWTDKHSGTFINKPGAVLTMPRNAVCDDADIGCSKGFHAGSLEYVENFACNYGSKHGDRIVLVEVDPADIVSIPKDCSCQKVRTCKYTVLQEYRGKLPDGGIKDTEDPYMEDFDDDEDDYCPDCGAVMDPEDGCLECSDEEVVLTQAELEELLNNARIDGGKQIIESLKATL